MNMQTIKRSLRLTSLALLCAWWINPAQAVTPIETEIQKLLASDGTSGNLFGRSVAIDGDTALVGAHQDDDNGISSGSTYVFRWSGSAWVQQAKLLAADGAFADWFGYSVAIDGDTALVGAHQDDDNGPHSGSAYVFHWNGSAWVQQAKLLPLDGAAIDNFGISVAIDGDTALVGAFLDDDNSQASGSAYVFHWNGSAWVQQAKLTAGDGAFADLFGYSVAIEGDTALVGAWADDDHGSNSGSAYVFSWNGSAWVQQAKLTAVDGAANAQFGYSVAIDGDTALVGAHQDDGNGPISGSAYVFHWNGSAWMQQAKLLAADGAIGDVFGFSVAINGDTALIGASLDDDNGDQAGSAYVFDRTGGVWSESLKLLASDGRPGDNLTSNTGVSISGSRVIAGAPFQDSNGTNAGAAYIFELASANTPPVANAGPDQSVEASANPTSLVTLDGTGSSDADGDPLTYSWSNTSVSANGVTPTLSLGLGVHTITLTVDDGSTTATDEVVITVQDTTPPVITAPGDLNVYASGALTTVAIGTATATDLFEPITIESDAPEQFPVGTTTVTWTATDPSGNSSQATQQVTVVYDWNGFFAPLDNLPTINSVKGGQTVPVKWNVPTPNGSYIRDTAIVSKLEIATVACEAEGSEYENAIEAETTGNSGLRYDLSAEQFVYNWKTSKPMKNSCRLFILGLNDGSYHYAKFKVK